MAGNHSPKRRRIDDDSTDHHHHQHLSVQPLRRAAHDRARDRPRSTYSSHDDSSRPHDAFSGPEPGVSAADTAALDRDWYNYGEEGAVLGDDSHDPFGGGGAAGDASWADQEREREMLERKLVLRNKVNAKFLQRQKDNDAWETNRMLASSVAQTRELLGGEMDEDGEETRVHLLVHDLKPPFLDGKTVFTKQLEPVSAVRDPQSDMAVFSRKGSKVVKERRQQKERQRQAQEATNVAGTALGNVMGVKEEDTDSAAPLNGAEDAQKPQGSKFADSTLR